LVLARCGGVVEGDFSALNGAVWPVPMHSVLGQKYRRGIPDPRGDRSDQLVQKAESLSNERLRPERLVAHRDSVRTADRLFTLMGTARAW
jgi:hypothetical protein